MSRAEVQDAAPEAADPARRPMGLWGAVKQALKPIASLRLTVVLFVLGFALVFFGTLAQIDKGIWVVVNEYFWSWLVWVPFQLLMKFGQIFFWLPTSWQVPGSFPLPGGQLLFWALLVNLLAAHLVRFKISWKRSGILLIHGGVLLMMAGEFITRTFAVEGVMTVEEGGSSSYVSDLRHYELAVLAPAGTDRDHVVAVPAARLKPGQTDRDDRLPFDIEVLEYFPNSDIRKPAPGDANPATAGYGRDLLAVSQPPVSGTSQEQNTDFPAAYVRFLHKGTGQPLGTYMLSALFEELPQYPLQQVDVDGQPYRVSLRFQRTYKPYTIHVDKVTHEVYPGTSIPKNFQSDVRVEDPETGVSREARIYMNNPLRHRGDTFYQHQMAAAEGRTTFQVVRNPGWLFHPLLTLPIVSCCVVFLGMLVHFGLNLGRFLRRAG
jgi:hypothetical protein